MSSIDLGTLEYNFLLNLEGFQQGAARVGVQLENLDRRTQERLTSIGNRSLQLANRVKVVHQDIARNERASAIAWESASLRLASAEGQLLKLNTALLQSEGRLQDARQKQLNIILASGKASDKTRGDIARYQVQIDSLREAIAHQTQVATLANERMIHSDQSWTEASLKNTARRNKAESDEAVARARRAYAQRAAIDKALADETKLRAAQEKFTASYAALLEKEEAGREAAAIRGMEIERRFAAERIALEKKVRASQEAFAEAYVVDLEKQEVAREAAAVRGMELERKFYVERLALIEKEAVARSASQKKALAAQEAYASKSLALWSSVGSKMMVVGALMAAPFVLSVNAAAEWQKQLALVGIMTGQIGAQLEATGNRIRSIAKAINVIPTETAKEFVKLREIGRTNEQAFTQLLAQGMAARGTMSDLKTVSSAVTEAMNTYHVSAARAVDVTDLLVAAQQKSKMSWEDLRTAFNQAGPVAMSFGLSMQDLVASFVALRNGGVAASQVGTVFSQALARLSHPTREAKELAHTLGLEWLHNNDAMAHIAKVGWPAALLEMEKATGGSMSKILALFGGASHSGGSRGMLVLLADQMRALAKSEVDMHNTTGASARASTEAQKTFTDSVTSLKVAWNELQISLGTRVLPALRELVTDVRGLVEWFDHLSPATMSVVTTIGFFGGALLVAGGGVIRFITTLVKLRNAYVEMQVAAEAAGAASAAAAGGGAVSAAAGAGVLARFGVPGLIAGAGVAASYGAYRLGGQLEGHYQGQMREEEKGLHPNRARSAAAYGRALNYVHTRNMGMHADDPDPEAQAVINHQLQARHKTSLSQLTIGQWRGMEADIAAGRANLVTGTRNRRTAPSTAAEHPAARPGDIFGPHGSLEGVPSTTTQTAAKTVAEKIARAAEAMLGQPGSTESTQDLVNRALRAAGITEKNRYPSQAFAELGRFGQRATTPRRGDVFQMGSDPRQVGVVLSTSGKQFTGAYDPVAGRTAHDVQSYPLNDADASFLRFGPLSGMEQQGQAAAERLAAQRRRAAEAARRRALAFQRQTERSTGLLGFQGELRRAYAMPEGEERINAVADITSRQAQFLGHIQRETIGDKGGTNQEKQAVTDSVNSLVSGIIEAARTKVDAFREKLGLRRQRGLIASEETGMRSNDKGLEAQLKDTLDLKTGTGLIDQIMANAKRKAELDRQLEISKMAPGDRNDPTSDARIAADKTRDEANIAAESERERRIEELTRKIDANDNKLQRALDKQVNDAITNEERRTRYLLQTPEQRATGMAAFIGKQAATPGLSAEAREGLTARQGELTDQAADETRKNANAEKLKSIRNKATLYPGEKDKSKGLLAVATGLETFANDPQSVLTDDERAALRAEAQNHRETAAAQSKEYGDSRSEYIQNREAEDMVLQARAEASGAKRRGFGLFGKSRGVDVENQVKALELLQEAQKKRQADDKYGYSDPIYFNTVKKEVAQLTRPHSLWEDMRADADKKFQSIADSFSKAVGDMAAKGGSLKLWFKSIWSDIVSWFTEYVVRQLLNGMSSIFSARGAQGQTGGGGIMGAIGSLAGGLFGGGGGHAGGSIVSNGTGAGSDALSLPTWGGGGNSAPGAGGIGMGGPLLAAAAKNPGGLAKLLPGVFGKKGFLSSIFSGKGIFAGGGSLGFLGPILGGVVTGFAVSGISKLFKGLFHHKHRTPLLFDDPVNDFHAGISGRDFTQLFLKGVSKEMASQTADIMSPRMSLMMAHGRRGTEVMNRLHINPMVAGGGGSGISLTLNNPAFLDKRTVDHLTDTVDRNLASKIIQRSGRGSFGGRDRL